MDIDFQSLMTQLLEMGFDEAKVTMALEKSKVKTIEGCIAYIENLDNNGGAPMQTESVQQNISALVNQEHVDFLMKLGYSRDVSEKSLLLSENKGTDAALDWISANKDKPDYEEKLFMMGQADGKSKLSKAEAEMKSRELQQQLREKRAKQEKLDAENREKERVRSTKEILEAKRIMEENETKRLAEQRLKEKKILELEKQQMLMQLQKDKEERFGSKAGAYLKPAKEILLPIFKQMRVVYPPQSLNYPNVMKTCLSTVKVYLNNLVANPTDPKFKRINMNNQAFENRVGSIIGGTKILNEIGFKEENGFLVLDGSTPARINEFIKVIDDEISKLQLESLINV